MALRVSGYTNPNFGEHEANLRNRLIGLVQ